MMGKTLKNCAIVRCFDYFLSRGEAICRASVPGRIGRWFSRVYAHSAVKRGMDAFRERGCAAEFSLYGRAMAVLHRLCARFGLWLLPILHASLIYRGCTAAGRWCLGIAKGSVLGRLWAKAGFDFRRFLIFVFSLYLPIDWMLRDVLKIAALASVWDELFFLGSAAVVVWLRIKDRNWDGKTRVTALDIPILLFCAVGFFLMCVNAPVPSIAVAGLRATIQYMLWFFVIARLLRDRGDLFTLCAGIAAVGVAMALHGIAQFILAVPIPDSWTTDSEAAIRTRAFSITGSPNILGAYLVLTAPIIAGFIYQLEKPWAKFLCWGCLGAEMLCLLATYSKGAWVGMVVAVLTFALLLDRRLLGVLAGGVSAVMFVPSISTRIAFLFTDEFATASAIGGRSLRWGIGLGLLEENPLFGFGLGRFGGAVAMQNQYLEITEDFYYFYMDNYYLKIAVEMGYIGIIFFAFLMICLLITGVKAVMRAEPHKVTNLRADGSVKRHHYTGGVKPMITGIAAGLTGVAAHCFFENIFEEPYMMALFWGLAAAVAVGTKCGNAKHSRE
ncbi:MAG: hypothetical protein E7463_13465 [Ruminococcaceae bacterium]|nr:hypothetical protein [Oscillospiraceae bacterium]